MFYMSEKSYKNKLRKIELNNKSKERKLALKEAGYKTKNKFKFPTTTKLLAFYLFIVLNAVLIYVLVAMWHFADLTYLGTLITDICGQILVFKIYTAKSTKENTRGGITFETAMAQLNKVDDTIENNNVCG